MRMSPHTRTANQMLHRTLDPAVCPLPRPVADIKRRYAPPLGRWEAAVQKRTKTGSKLVIDDRWLRVTADECKTESGQVVAPYYVVHEPDWVQIYAVNTIAQVLTVRQYRYAADAFCTELPGGVVEADETPEFAAKRELLEETGFVAGEWTYVGKLFANPARQTNAVHLFIAENLEALAGQQLEESEDLTWAFMSTAELDEEIEKGEFTQALHVASVLRAERVLRSRLHAQHVAATDV